MMKKYLRNRQYRVWIYETFEIVVCCISLEKSINLYNKMEEKPLTNAQLEKATSRRSRKDEEGRDFQCGCGKRYLSYPALYTHIKTKHDGRQPEGTQKTGAASAITKRSKGKIEEETLKVIHSYLEREDLRLLTELQEGHLGSVPIQFRIRKENLPKEVYDCYVAIMKHQDCKLNKNSSLEQALTVYLLNVGDYVNDKVFDYYVIFAKIARNCFHDHGEELYRACFHKKDSGPLQLPSFSNTEVAYFPMISDFLIKLYVPGQEFNKQNRDLIIRMIELITSDFCAWLFRRKLTTIKIKLMREYKLDIKPVATTVVKQKNTPKKDEPSKEKEHKSNSSNSEEHKKPHEEESEEMSEVEEQDEEHLQRQEDTQRKVQVPKEAEPNEN